MAQVVPMVPELGNTSSSSGSKKRPNPAKKWCFTLNNYTENEVSILSGSMVPTIFVKRIMFQSEVSESGTEHLQGWVEFKSKKRPLEVFKLKRIHWEKMKGTVKQNIEYCSKSEKLNDGFVKGMHDGKIRFTIGCRFKYKGPDIVLTDWEKDVVEILKKEIKPDTPEYRNIYWIWEPEGGRGKSTFAKWIWHNMDGVVVTDGKAGDMKHGIAQYVTENDDTPKIVLVDIPRVNEGHFSIAGIESIKNMFFRSGKYEGMQVSGPRPHVVIMANCEPEYEKMSIDKWRIMDLRDDKPKFKRI